MVKLWRCEICGDPYIGDEAPTNCPFCGAHQKHIKEFKDAKADFNVELNEKDKANAEHALEVEISNAAFYFCAAEKVKELEGQKLFKALGKVEAEHAAIWKKILKLDSIPTGKDTCSTEYKDDLQESHARETRAIEFYSKAAKESENQRVKEIFEALVVIETDHLKLSEQRLG
ncbi:ferritin [Candidatus Woesearchaeota archaeon]|nr:ferritin [Candidatus Woesearchaeota archaeon]MBW3017374.1 ferritin [Candidatus Woesearchaeota archaeon]